MVDLKKGVSILYDLELNNYFMTHTISQIKKKKSGLCKQKNIPQPAKRKNEFSIWGAIFTTALILAIIGAIVGLVLAIMYCKEEGFFKLKNLSFASICMSAVAMVIGVVAVGLGGAVAGVVVGLIIGIIGKVVQQNKVKGENEYYELEYSKKMAAEKKRMEEETEKSNFLQKQLDIMQGKLKASKTLLANVYDYVGIDSGFRNLICMGYMDEYLRLGIATKLGGVDGLYFVIKQQLNYDQINASINVIIDKLDTIIDNQTKLYKLIDDMNAKCSVMISSLDKIAYNTYSTAYDSVVNTYVDERQDAEIAYLNYINS